MRDDPNRAAALRPLKLSGRPGLASVEHEVCDAAAAERCPWRAVLLEAPLPRLPPQLAIGAPGDHAADHILILPRPDLPAEGGGGVAGGPPWLSPSCVAEKKWRAPCGMKDLKAARTTMACHRQSLIASLVATARSTAAWASEATPATPDPSCKPPEARTLMITPKLICAIALTPLGRLGPRRGDQDSQKR